jgi:hypothetical protein
MKRKNVAMEIRTYKDHYLMLQVMQSEKNLEFYYFAEFKRGKQVSSSSGNRLDVYDAASSILLARPASVIKGRMASQFVKYFRDTYIQSMMAEQSQVANA